MLYQIRKRTKLEDIVYALYIYFDGLSLRSTSEALSRFVKRSHTAIRDWIQKYKPDALFHNSEIRFLMIGLCFHITNFESIFHRLELNVAYNYEKIELCNKAQT